MRIDISITIEDRDYPWLNLIVKCGPHVVQEKALVDVAATKFQAPINNVIQRALSTQQLQQKERTK